MPRGLSLSPAASIDRRQSGVLPRAEAALLRAAKRVVDIGVRILSWRRSHSSAVVRKGEQEFVTSVGLRLPAGSRPG